MIGQNDECVNAKWMGAFHHANSLTQQINVPNQQIIAAAFQKIHGKEPSAADVPGATIVGHGFSLSGI